MTESPASSPCSALPSKSPMKLQITVPAIPSKSPNRRSIKLTPATPATANPPAAKHPPTATQSAKVEIRAQTRDDWAWPLPPGQQQSSSRLNPTTEWRERDSDSSPSPPTSLILDNDKKFKDPYKFESPDSLLSFPPQQSRKRKRHHALHSEMTWNSGLRTFIARRDAWTGARIPSPPPPDLFTIPSEPPSSHLSWSFQQPLPAPPVLPLAPPLLPSTHSIRASITPQTYPAIYSKVVVQGLSPTVPVNLKDVVRAMVVGWKSEGEWPPKGEGDGKGGANGGIGGKEGNGRGGAAGEAKGLAKRGVGRVRRVLGLGGELLGEKGEGV